MNLVSLLLLSVLVDPLPPNNLLEDVWFVDEGTYFYPPLDWAETYGWSFERWTMTPSPSPELDDDYSAAFVCEISGFCLVRDHGEALPLYLGSLYQSVPGQGSGIYRFGVYFKHESILWAEWQIYGHDQEDPDTSEVVAFLRTIYSVSHTSWPTRGSSSPQAEPIWKHSGWRDLHLPEYPYYSVVLFVELDKAPVDENNLPQWASRLWSTGWYFGKSLESAPTR